MIPNDLLYTKDHEWVRVENDVVRIGITDFAQSALGDIVYVAPAPLGDQLDQGAALGEVESTKSVSEVYAPVAGTVAARNEALDETPELLNTDPYGEGWLVEISGFDTSALGALLDSAAYQAHVEGA